MSKLVFFIGAAGAGKTTLAKTLASKRGAVLLDMDTLLRPAAEMIMTLAGLDPNDRDSAEYKRLCRDLGYRITMDAALENAATGTDAFVIGPFTKETEDPQWIHEELSRIGASIHNIEVKVIVVYLSNMEEYRHRIEARNSALDVWKLDNWSVFSTSLSRRELKWNLPSGSVFYYDNSPTLDDRAVSIIETFVYGKSTNSNS